MSLVARPSKNHFRKLVVDSVDDRKTPLAIFEPLNRRYQFTLDAAASDENHRCAKYYTTRTDGLLHAWKGERVWCNPPYSRLDPWLAKAWREMAHGCELVVMLLPANRAEQPFWQEHVEPFRDRGDRNGILLTTQFLPGRFSFLAADKRIPSKSDRPPFGCVLLTWETA